MKAAEAGRKPGRAGAWLKELVLVLPAAWYPAWFVYFHNAAEATLSQVWFPLGLLTAAAAVCFLLFSAAARNAVAGGIVAMAAIALTAFWRPAEELARYLCWSLRYWHLAPLALAGSVALAIALPKAARRWSLSLERVRTVMCALFLSLIAYNFVLAAPVLWNKGRPAVSPEDAAAPVPAPNAARGDSPNVYLIILDEYAPFAMAKKYYGYVPAEFEAFLKAHRFNVSTNGRNPSFYTSDVLAGLIGMELPEETTRYTLGPDGRLDKLAHCPGQDKVYAESKLMRFFKDRGYSVHVANMLGDIFNFRTPFFCDEYFRLPVDQRGISLENTVASVVLARSALEPIRSLLPVDVHYYNRMVEGIFQWIEESAEKPAPRFLWAHVTCPHGPYLFESDGGWRQEAGSATDPQYYLAQYQYVTMRIMKVLATLVEKDPDAVILLMSDHSARQNLGLPAEDMARIFNAVYFRGEELDVEGLSGLDTELSVLNRLFGTTFPVFRGLRPLAGVEP